MKVSKRAARAQERLRENTIELLQRRQKKNPKYSLRALARHVGVGKSTLSGFLGGKRRLSPTNSRKIAEHLRDSGEAPHPDTGTKSETPPPFPLNQT